MLIPIKSRSDLKLGHIVSKSRSLCQIIEKNLICDLGHSIDPKLMKLCQNVNPHNI